MPDAACPPTPNPLLELPRLGQAVWLDFIRRRMLESGELARLIREDGVRGVTSNPAIFEKAIGAGDEYAAPILSIAPTVGFIPRRIYEELAIDDVRKAADVLAGVYRDTDGADGFVSLEVSPELAHDAEGSVAEARRFWSEVDRPNLMIKVPGTREGISATQTLLTEGIHVNVTLLFARGAYAKTAEAYLRALEKRLEEGQPIDRAASVASFFVSRIDSLVDQLVDQRLATVTAESDRNRLAALRGQIAIANAKLAYRHYQELIASERWQRLAAAGARPQRLLWASTSTKNPAYRDTVYVEELIGADTVNTMPPETVAAFRDHGVARATLSENVEAAQVALDTLDEYGISLREVSHQLLSEGIEKFVQPFERLLKTVEARTRELVGGRG
ncbi:MAG: transaldolase [Thermoanaerobaculia bacterium]|nr:transaldolase [Thermoanaerobaculia bacterium]